MNVAELIDRLNKYDPNTEVRLMTQQNWPFECVVAGVVSRLEMVQYEDETPHGALHRVPPCVFITEGAQLQYGSKLAWEASGC